MIKLGSSLKTRCSSHGQTGNCSFDSNSAMLQHNLQLSIHNLLLQVVTEDLFYFWLVLVFILPYIDEITLWCQGGEKNWSRVNQQTAGNKWMKISKKLETYFHN